MNLKILIIVVSILIMLITLIQIPETSSGLKITALDVGQGDAFLIQTIDNKVVVIDLGKDESIVAQLIYLKLARFIDLLIVTHQDNDHFGGFESLSKNFQIAKVIANFKSKDLVFDTPQYFPILIGCCTNLEFIEYNYGEENNEKSLVVLVTYEGRKALFTGDLPLDYESQILQKVGDIDILKVAHHGSGGSSGLALLMRTTPSYCMISVGVNNYGHPNQSVLKRLQDVGCVILRTDEIGTYTLLIDKNRTRFLSRLNYLW